MSTRSNRLITVIFDGNVENLTLKSTVEVKTRNILLNQLLSLTEKYFYLIARNFEGEIYLNNDEKKIYLGTNLLDKDKSKY